MRNDYTVGCVVLLGCSHVREMKGETDEVVRRTRSDAAESAVVNLVRETGVEPAWFWEVWRDEDARLVCPMVFEREEDAAKFEEAAAKCAGEDMFVVDDEVMANECAEHLNSEWRRIHGLEMEKRRAVVKDAVERGFAKRCAVGEWKETGDAGAESWKAWMQGMMEKWPNDAKGRGGVAYSACLGEDGVMRFAVCVPDGGELDEDERVTWKKVGEDMKDEELEMCALTIAKMRQDEKDAADEKEIGDAVKDAAEKAVAKAAADMDAAECAKHAD